MTKRAKVTARHQAGADHQVVTVTGGRFIHRTTPCDTCPWRKDAVGEFPAEAFKHSAHTAYDMDQTTFACHSTGTRKPATCAGFLLKNSANNLAVRLHLMKGDYVHGTVSDGGHELFNSYREMAEANGVAPDDPVLQRCRADN